MDNNEFSLYLKNELNKYDIKISNKMSEIMYAYMIGLLEWNNKINVTAIKDQKEFIMKHYVDSLIAARYMEINDLKIIDVGTGGGFPGIPLKVLFPDRKFTLLDAVNKKLNVIKELAQKNEINNIELIHGRAEDLGQNINHREQYDIVISRAVANLTTLVELLIPLAKMNGKIICMKGPGLEEELKLAQKAINLLGGQIEKCDEYDLDGEKRKVLVIKKIRKTPKTYPRKAGNPLKNPLY